MHDPGALRHAAIGAECFRSLDKDPSMVYLLSLVVTIIPSVSDHSVLTIQVSNDPSSTHAAGGLTPSHAAARKQAGRQASIAHSLDSLVNQQLKLLTSTRPPLSTTSLKSRYKSRGCLAMMGMRVMGDPV